MRKNLLVKLLSLIIGLILPFCIMACDKAPAPINPTKLGGVTVTLNDNVASWEEVENAARYAYQINEEEVVETTLREVALEDGDTIKVKAIGDGKNYTDGDYCEKITYTAPPAEEEPKPEPTKLGKVTLLLTDNVASWETVENAVRYAYQINEEEVVETTLKEVVLEDGDTIKVKAIGDGKNYTDGDYCEEIRYTAPPAEEEPKPVKLATPNVTLSGHTASWETIANASRYAYRINDEDVVETTLRSVVLAAGDAIQVKAIGDSENYTDSDYCALVTHNTIYDAPINTGAVALSLNTLDTLSSATAATDGSFAAFRDTVLKAFGEASYGIQYLKTASVTIPMIRNGAPMTREKLSIYDEIRVWVLVPIDSVYAGIVPTINVGSQTFNASTLKDGWNELKLNVNTLIAEGFISSITINVSQATIASVNAPYVMRVDNLVGVYNEQLNLGNVMIFGDSYSTFEGYLNDPRFYYYSDKAVAQTDLTKVEQTWWGQILSNTKSNLIMNNSVSGSTVCGTTYGTTAAPQDSFVERMDALIANGYFERNTVNTFFIFGGTNDSWGGSPLGAAKYSGWTEADKYEVLPSICYMVAKAKEVAPNAQIIVVLNTYESMNDALVPGFKPTPIDYQTPIMNAVKGFVEFGKSIHIVALNDHENNNINLMGLHPTVSGATAIKDQILNILYERKYLAEAYWTQFEGKTASVPTEVVVQDFSKDIGSHYNATVEVTTNPAYTKDGNGAWKVTETDTSVGHCYLIGQLITSLDSYSQIKFYVYANAAAAGTSIYLDLNTPISYGTFLGTVQEGWNEFTISADRVLLEHVAGWPLHIRLVCHLGVGAELYFDSITGITKV